VEQELFVQQVLNLEIEDLLLYFQQLHQQVAEEVKVKLQDHHQIYLVVQVVVVLIFQVFLEQEIHHQ
jgi:hypothetical protein